jgi:hypothetical protein
MNIPDDETLTTVPLRVRFTSFMRAFELFHSFPPDDLDYLDVWCTKRDGDSKVMILQMADPSRLQDFLDLCTANPDIVEVTRITEDEFWRAPSNSI